MLLLALSAQLLAVELPSPRFQWLAPDDEFARCPTEEALRVRVGAIAEEVKATATRTEAGWRLNVQVNDSIRELTTSTCAEAGDAAVLIVQLAFEHLPPRRPIRDEPPRAVVAPSPSTLERPKWQVRLSLLGGTRAAWLQVPLGRVAAALSFHRGPLALTVDVATVLPARLAGGPTPDAGVVVQVPLEGHAGACGLFGGGRWSVGPCAFVGLGWFVARGDNVIGATEGSMAVWSIGGGARGAVALTSWLDLNAQASLKFGNRPSVFFEGFQPVVQSGVAAVDVLAGIGARF